ncbi:hypothetical protein SSP24_82020 [Streptomyces spinoverrucosus]|uniref:Peptidase M14 domain-containing protein n=1 Tax=Streptomyces spinoverrucosus TaxID=284043 RepID=A0A4Y3VUK4_9ACTN|nr:M14-type cytosolic carboxypeptidase [Streptomyces spinoverrucosus]GEC10547.1 hypothetical protein SSP24_82020 [Streptomyces spinoverrucosus]GHB98805.1 hypothetical protein GCM10010397_83940 [Streptomyces spinoverrucosus]
MPDRSGFETTVSHTGFTSFSCRFSGFDEATATLHVELIEQGRYGYPHWFEFEFDLDCLPMSPPDVITVSLGNAGASQYRNGWPGYRPYVERAKGWIRLDEGGTYQDGVFQFRVPLVGRRLRVAWYEPYDLNRMHRAVLGNAHEDTVRVTMEDDGFVCVEAGDPALPAVVLIARQHPGEVISSFFAEGLLDTLLAREGVGSEFFAQHSLVVIPIMNTGGVRRQLHRMDEAGIDYNRTWGERSAPTPVTRVRKLLEDGRSIRLFADIHGDEVSQVSYISYQFGRGTGDRDREPLTGFLSQLTDNCGHPVHVWETPSFARRFARALVRQRRLLIRPGLMADRYVARTLPCLSLTYELSAAEVTPDEAIRQGRRFATALAEMALHRVG